MWAAAKELKIDLAKLREELPREYIAKDEYRNDVKELKDLLQNSLIGWTLKPTSMGEIDEILALIGIAAIFCVVWNWLTK